MQYCAELRLASLVVWGDSAVLQTVAQVLCQLAAEVMPVLAVHTHTHTHTHTHIHQDTAGSLTQLQLAVAHSRPDRPSKPHSLSVTLPNAVRPSSPSSLHNAIDIESPGLTACLYSVPD